MTIVPFLHRLSDLIINPILMLAFGIAFMYFLYSVVKFLRIDAADKSREEAKYAILWSLVGMLVMFSVYGLIRFVLATFGIDPYDDSLINANPFIRQ